MTESVTSYELSHEKGVVINGEKFPYLVAVDPMFRVQPMPGAEEFMHILWLPLMADGACPEVGEPKGAVTFTDLEKDQVKALVESGDTLQAQKIILRRLEAEFANGGGDHA